MADSGTAAKSGKPVRRRMSAAQRREALLEQAAVLAEEQGLEAVTIERVAECSGVSRALVYGYFENSDALLAALFDDVVGEMDADIMRQIAGVPTAEQRLQIVIKITLEHVERRGVLLGRLFQSYRQEGALADVRSRRQAFVEDYFAQEMVADRGISPERAKAAAAILQSAFLATLDIAHSGRLSTDLLIDTYLRMAMASVAALSCPHVQHLGR